MSSFSAFSDLGTVYTFDFPLLFDFISFLILSLLLGIISFFSGNKEFLF
jgi:hypothetical protein